MPAWTTIYVNLYWYVLLPCTFAACWRWGDGVLHSASSWYAPLVLIGRIGLSKIMYLRLELVQAATDVTLLVAFTWLAIRHSRAWLIAIAAIQLLACLGHLAIVTYHPSRLGYALMTGIGGYPILLILAGVLIAQRLNPSILTRHHAFGSLGATPTE